MKEKVVKFEDVKLDIVETMRVKYQSLGINERLTLIDGFLNNPVSNELSSSVILGGPSIPMIMFVGNDSGRIYLFALKAILKTI